MTPLAKYMAVAVLGALAWPQSVAAATRNCTSDILLQCRKAGCEQPEELHSSLVLDYDRRSLTYCVGTACFEARLAVVKSQGEELIAFNGQRAQPGQPRFAGGLATIHQGGKSATIGRFEADGSASFSPMTCE
jgi:hypothetical protein